MTDRERELRCVISDLRDELQDKDDQLQAAIMMLAEWCVAVDENGTGWDDWDEHYKDAMYRPGTLRERLDVAISKVREVRGSE
jgi:hypothetical protein